MANPNLMNQKQIIDVVKFRWLWLAISAVLLIPCIAAIIYLMATQANHAPVKLGIDFTGGTILQYSTKDKIGTEVSGDEFQGVIQFNRHKSDGTEQLLEYMPLGEEDAVNGNTLYGLINQANGEGGVSESVIKSARNKILN